MTPHTHVRSLPPGPCKGPYVARGGRACLETALREAA
jgi:hypothetical protein